MTVFLNLLFVFVAVLFFAGRLYETAFLLEEGTNFLVRGGIVSKPLMLAIVFLISVCCGVLIYSDKKPQVKKLKIPVGIFGMASGALIIVSAILSIVRIFTVTGGFLGFDMMLILGGVGLILYGSKGIKGKDSEKLPMVLTVLFPISLCMTTVTVNVQPLADTFYMYRGLSAITTLAFFLFLFKNAYSPSALSKPVLYVAALLNFLVSTSATLANIIGGLVTKALLPADIAMNIALVILGAFSLFTATPTSAREMMEDAAASVRLSAMVFFQMPPLRYASCNFSVLVSIFTSRITGMMGWIQASSGPRYPFAQMPLSLAIHSPHRETQAGQTVQVDLLLPELLTMHLQ